MYPHSHPQAHPHPQAQNQNQAQAQPQAPSHLYHHAGTPPYPRHLPHRSSQAVILPSVQQPGAPSHQYPTPNPIPHHPGHQQQQQSQVNRPIHFKEGQFAGRTIRASLDELQAASFGRKYAKVDRRPLDPPPVVCLRLFEVFDDGAGGETESEIDYDNIHIMGLMCMVDLIPVNPPAPSPTTSAPSPSTSTPYSPPQSPQSPYYSTAYPRPGENATSALAGTTFVQVDSIPWKGRTSLLFTFADLAVKTEGYFILQYRYFDIFSTAAGHAEQQIQSLCRGDAFRIYSSKEVPPLGKSTELTKHLARYGVRVNVRETERKRKKKEPSGSSSVIPSPPYTTRKVPDRGCSDRSEDDE